MAKNDPLSFDFGYNVAPKPKKTGATKKGGKRKLSPAQKYTAQFYMKPRRR
jgi:hypothetical protein